MLIRWEKLPLFMQTEDVRPYYDALQKHRLELLIKRTFDFTMSSIMLVVLSPILLFLAIWIKVDSKGPVFYRQERMTQYGQKFCIYKFRTMVQNADQIGDLVTMKGDSRITRVGTKLRGYRLDELPQLINIWKGEMTFVGTRPEVPKYVKQYTKEMYATLLLPAGVTSQASIEFKDEDELIAEGLKEGLSVDMAYLKVVLPQKMWWNLLMLKTFSLREECVILVKTLKAVMK